MVEIGKYNTLKIVKDLDFGVYLDGGNGVEILLPTRYVPKNVKPGDEVEVFIYHDNEGRLIATTARPLATVGEFQFMEVKDVNNAGAFLEWGIMKDLLVPFKEQKMPMREGKWYLVYVRLDHVTGRIMASARIEKFLNNTPIDYEQNQEVQLLVADETDLGYKVIINNQHWGLIYYNEVFQRLEKGEHLKGYIKEVREDDKIDVSLTPQYVIGSQYLNAQFNQYLPSPEIMMISLITISSLGVCVYLTVHFAKELRKELTPILEATKEIENNNLDFTIGHSKILEFENVIISFDSMRNSLKGSLEKQWRSEKAQRDQIASLAHDLKTPLTVMQGNIDLLDETELDEEQKLYLSYAMSSSEQMKQYIKILIDISKASAGYQLQMEDVNFPEFWKHILSLTEIICKDKGIVIQQTQHNFPQNITGDRMLLERALMNLVSNSLEYSPENSTLYIDVDSKDNYLNICITDCGCGFSQEALDHAKERFYMADQSRSSKLHYGMGLYIVDIIIKQ